MKKRFRAIAGDLITDVFVGVLLLYATLLICEGLRSGFVNYFFDLGHISLAVFAIGALAVLVRKKAAAGS